MLFMPSRASSVTAHPRPSELRSTTTSTSRPDRKLNDRETAEQEALLQVVPHADCPTYPSGFAFLPEPYLYVRSSR